MRTTCTRRQLLAGTVALAIAGSSRGTLARQEDDLPGLERRTFTSNFYEHELTWSRDWKPDLARSFVSEEHGNEGIVLIDATVDEDDEPTVVNLTLSAGEDFSADEFIANLPHGSIDSPNYPEKASVFGEGNDDRSAWFVWGWEPDDEDNGHVAIVQYLFPQEAGDPLVSLGIVMSGQHVEEDLLERLDDEIEFDGASIFVLEDYDEIWDLIAEVY
jgi:hypothetical protein